MMIDGYVAEILNNQIMNEINAKKATDKEKLIEKDIKSIENRVRHAFNQGYEAGLKHGKEQEPKIDMESEEIKSLQKRAHLEGFHEALKMSVKQKPLTDVLDKIRADIEQYQADCDLSSSDDVNCRTCDRITFDTILGIIDKYKTESEGSRESN